MKKKSFWKYGIKAENIEKRLMLSGYAPTWDCHNSRQLPSCTVAAMEDSTLSI